MKERKSSKLLIRACAAYALFSLVVAFHCDAGAVPCSCHARLLVLPCAIKRYATAVLCALRSGVGCFARRIALAPAQAAVVALRFAWRFIIEPASRLLWPLTWVALRLLRTAECAYRCCFPLFRALFSLLKVALSPLRFVTMILSPAARAQCTRSGANYWSDAFGCVAAKAQRQFAVLLKCADIVIDSVDRAVAYFGRSGFETGGEVIL